MAGIGDLKQELTMATYQNFDGSNRTVGLYGIKKPVGDFSFSAGMGYSTDFKDDLNALFEAKGSYSPDGHNSLQLRIRSTHGAINTTQFRFSPGMKETFETGTSIYMNPYASATIDYGNGKWNYDVGVFGGVEQDLGSGMKLAAEVQRYGLQNPADNSPKNWGVNVVFTKTF